MLNDAIIDQINSGIILVDKDVTVQRWNRFMADHSGRSKEEVIGRSLFEWFPELPEKWLRNKINSVFILGNQAFTSWEQRPYLFKFLPNQAVTGRLDHMLQDCHMFPIANEQGEVAYVCITLFDVTDVGLYQRLLKQTNDEQQRLIQQLEEAQSQLMQSEKMAAIGQLAAGVAHEINNPVGFVASNLNTMRGYVEDLLAIIDGYEKAESVLAAAPEVLNAVTAIKQDKELDYLKEDVRELLDESDDGLKRVTRIVKDLKDFSRPDADDWGWHNLHEGLDSTLNVVRNEIKYKADIVKEYAELPLVECKISQLNQVFMNLIVNAAHAINEHGTITLRTGVADRKVWVEVRDTGKGIAPEHLSKLFDPFFTTKPVGQGTGLGLSVSFGIINKHKGRFEVESEVGQGTCFRVWLPVAQGESGESPPVSASA